MSNAAIKQLEAVIKMPNKWGDRIIRLQQIESNLSNNTYFPSGWLAGTLDLAQFTTDIVDFTDAETGVKNRVAGAMGLRSTAYTTIKTDLQLILAMVQSAANANAMLAEAIIGFRNV